MMKKLIWILILGVACKQAALAQQRTPRITPLPFGPAESSAKTFCKDSWFYYNLIGKGYKLYEGFKQYTPTYSLPPIAKYQFLNPTPDYRGNHCHDSTYVDSLIKITKYRVRLPDRDGYQVYYMTGYTGQDSLFANTDNYNCRSFNYSLYGFLIFYESTQQLARLLPVYYNYFGDESVQVRQFYIDANYRILLCDKSFGEGDPDGGDPVSRDIGPVYEVKINRNGKLTIK